MKDGEIRAAVLAMEESSWLSATDGVPIPDEVEEVARMAFRLGYQKSLLDVTESGGFDKFIKRGIEKVIQQYDG